AALGGDYAPPRQSAPAQVSRAWVRTAVLRGGRASVDIPVMGGRELLVWTIASSQPADAGAVAMPVRAALAGPSGLTMETGVRQFPIEDALPGFGVHGAQQALQVGAPADGVYRLDLEGAADRPTVVT